MTEKIYANQEKKATINCPECNRQWFKDVSNFYDLALKKEVHLKISCTCGHTWSAILEKRRYVRKKVTIMGTYTYLPPNRSAYKGQMEIWDISIKGMKVKLDKDWELNIGDWLDVEFRLNDSHHTLIKKRVNVKNISGQTMSLVFRDTATVDPALGFYLK